MFRSFVPKQYGGYEIDLDLFVDIGVAVSEACPSTGWITTFYMEHNWLLGLFDEELQREIFTAQPFILAPGTVNPSGEATPRGGRLRALGALAVRHGRRPCGLGDLVGHGAGEEAPMSRMFLVPVGEVEVKDTWHVDGMAATGSRDIVARSVFVPDRRVSHAPPPTWLLAHDEPYLRRLPDAPRSSRSPRPSPRSVVPVVRSSCSRSA